MTRLLAYGGDPNYELVRQLGLTAGSYVCLTTGQLMGRKTRAHGRVSPGMVVAVETPFQNSLVASCPHKLVRNEDDLPHSSLEGAFPRQDQQECLHVEDSMVYTFKGAHLKPYFAIPLLPHWLNSTHTPARACGFHAEPN